MTAARPGRDDLRDERLRRHASATRVGSGAALVLAAVLVGVAGPQVPGAWTAAWLAALGAALLLRVLALRWHRRHPDQPERALRHYRLSFLAHGLAWSLVAAALLPPQTEAVHDALLLAVVGIGASSMIGASFDVRAVAWFAVPPLATASLAMALGGRGSTLVMVLMFIALTALGMRRAHGALVEQMALRESVEDQAARGRLLDHLLDATPQGFVFVDAQSRVARVNPALGDWLGVDTTDWAGRGLDALPDGVRQALAPLLERARSQGRAEGEVEHRRGEESVAALVTVTSLGNQEGLVAVWTDISARRRAERELQMHRAVTNSITDLVSVIDESRRYRLVNDAWCRATGISRERAIGLHLDDVPRPTATDDRLRAIEDCLRLQQRRAVRSELDLPGLPRRHIETTYYPYAHADERLRSAVLVSRDVSAEVEAQEAQQRHGAELQALLDAFPGSIAAVDRDIRYAFVNARLAWLMGVPIEQMVGRRIAEVIGEAYAEEVAAAFRTVVDQDGSAVYHRHMPERGDRPAVDIRVHCVSGVDPASGQRMMYAFGTDITELRRAEAEALAARDEAQRANRAKSTFLSQMSHELRTPMNAILGFGQLIQADRQQRLDEATRGWAREIVRAGQHLLNLINEVLDLGRIEAGRLPISLEPVALAGLVDECLSLVRPLAAERQVRLLHDTPLDAGLAVRADRTRLKQVLLNLLGNALKYNREGGEARLVVAAHPDTVQLAVHDDGPGIDPARIDRLFTPFERLGADTGPVEGSGIGLALSRGLVQAMGGRIGVDTQAGTGSRFWVELPRTELADRPAAPADTAAAPRTGPADGTRVVLYIEDNPVNAMLMEAMLDDLPGLRLLVATQPAEGLELARRERPALVLTDIQMPGMDGFEVLRRLRARAETRHIPVLAVSANAMPADVAEALGAGFAEYLTKPLDLQALHDAVQRALDR